MRYTHVIIIQVEQWYYWITGDPGEDCCGIKKSIEEEVTGLYFEGRVAFGKVEEAEEVENFQYREKNPHSMKMGILKELCRKHKVIIICWTFAIRK